MDFRPMSPEEMERTMQFLLHHQAQFAADFETHSGRMTRIEDTLERLTGRVDGLTSRVEGLTSRVEGLNGSVERLTGVVAGLTEVVGGITDHAGHMADYLGHVTERLDRLGAAQNQTDQQMKDLLRTINERDARWNEMFERHLREFHSQRPS